MDYREFGVPRGTIDNYVKLLLDWNEKINLISVKGREELVDRHILDSLQLMKYIKKDQEVCDVGSGAGFPGLMLSYAGVKKIHLVEKISKKANFLIVAAALSVNEVLVHTSSIENVRINYCDIITSRGFSSLDNIFLATKNIYRSQTKYILQKGKNIEEEIKNALENWDFEYIMHKSDTSEEGCILQVEHLKANDKKNNSGSESKRRSR